MPESKAQVRAAYAVKSGKARKGLMPRDVADEIISKLSKGDYKRLPERSKRGRK